MLAQGHPQTTRLSDDGSLAASRNGLISRRQASPAQIQPELSSATSLINPADVTSVRPHHAVYRFTIQGGDLKEGYAGTNDLYDTRDGRNT